ncbi:ABC transporter permease [candidate division KSB1 bacterium]|nr:ABC transporter permease [candidate division KSB1 bacterium]
MSILGNYFTLTIRNLLRQKVYTAINIAGLAIGMSCCLIILMIVADELSYDRFHKNADRLYRVTLDAHVQDREFITARSSGPVAPSLRESLPEVEAATHIRARGGTPVSDCAVRYGDKAFNEYLLFFADSSFFKVFSCEVLEGDVNTFLTQPNTIVITEVTARKYFGAEPALGKTLEVDGRSQFMICGVVKEFPQQSHWRFSLLASLVGRTISERDNWLNNSWSTYVLLKKGASREQAEATFQAIVEKNVRPAVEEELGGNWSEMKSQGMYYRYRFQPVTSIHLHSRLDEEVFPPGNAATVYALGMIAVFILLIACINFMNLATARSARRAKEVGVRKVLGSQALQLIFLFVGEAALLAALAMLVSLGLMELALPVVNSIASKSLSLETFTNPPALAGLVAFTILVGVLAGSYPAFVLSSFQPANVLKGELRSGMRSGRMRSALVVLQFAISIALMVGTMAVYRQLQFIRTRDLGFDKEQMLVVDNTWLLGRSKAQSFKETLLSRPGVTAAAFTQNLPGNDIGSAAYWREGDNASSLIMLRQLWCDYDFLNVMGVRLKEGRFFNREFTTDSSTAVVINERAASLLGYERPVGRKLNGFFGDGEKALDIIGVTEDVHYEPLHQPILPMVALISRGAPTRIVLRVRGDIPAVIRDVEEQWKTFSGGQPFTTYFLDDRLERYYRADQALGKLFGIFAGVGIFISCLGLLGLVTYATEQRTKEIGIRKTLGATTPSIVGLLSKEFVKLVVVANLIAWPLSYYFINGWLQDFAYRIDLSWGVFVLAGGLALVIALLTVSAQTIKAALSNPVEALRYE